MNDVSRRKKVRTVDSEGFRPTPAGNRRKDRVKEALMIEAPDEGLSLLFHGP